jgi:hypothetical protein
MSNKENEKVDDKLSSTEKPGEVVREDPLADTSRLLSHEVPPGVDRRNFLIRSAVGGAAAVMMGRSVSAHERTAMAIATLPVLPQAASTPPLSADLNVVKKEKGPVTDDGGRVLQGRAGSLKLAHDRPNAYHLRFLSKGTQNCLRTNWPRQLSFRSTCSAVSAQPARDTAQSAPLWPDW